MPLQRLDEYVRSNVGVSERGSMQQWQAKHEVVLGHGRHQKTRLGGGILYACYGSVATLLLHWGHSSPHCSIFGDSS
jgi:hypothetical protein